MTQNDPQPMSRRAARMSERAAQGEPTTDEQVASQPGDDASDAQIPAGRRAARAAFGQPLDEQLAPAVDAGDELPATVAIPKQERPQYVPRDYSPEGRRQAPAFGQQPRYGGDLGYVTQARADVVSSVPAAIQAPSSSDAEPSGFSPEGSLHDPAPERTLTRRELRALREQQEAERLAQSEAEQPESIDFLLRSGPIELPRIAQPEAVEPTTAATWIVPTPATPTSDAADDEPVTRVLPGSTPAPMPTPAALRPAEPVLPVAAEPAAADAPAAPSFTDLIALQGQRANRPVAAATPRPVQPAPISEVPGPVRRTQPADAAQPEVTSSVPPFGHWSTQTDETPHGSSSAPSALVMPTSNPTDFAYTLSTGEIMVTGSIDLPAHLGRTGTTGRIDDLGLDQLLDPGDRDESLDSQPVRAVRAVSSHTNTRGMIAAKRPKGNRLPTVLAIAASVMALVVVSLIIVSAVTGSL